MQLFLRAIAKRCGTRHRGLSVPPQDCRFTSGAPLFGSTTMFRKSMGIQDMTDRVDRSGLQVDAALAAFIETDVLGPVGIAAADFWAGFAGLVDRFVPVNRGLLARRDELQAKIDDWYRARKGQPLDVAAQRVPERNRLSGSRTGAVRHRDDQCRCGNRHHGRAAAGRSGSQRPVPAQCGQCALGQSL
jgi:hypothetical protein